jgi:hypothetical protein
VTPAEEAALIHARWRVGRSVGRTIYACGPDGDDVLIGMLDTPALAADAVRTHNATVVRP